MNQVHCVRTLKTVANILHTKQRPLRSQIIPYSKASFFNIQYRKFHLLISHFIVSVFKSKNYFYLKYSLCYFRRIMVMPRYSTASSGERLKSLGIFLQCTPEGEGTSWSCQASAKITIINQKVADESFTRSKS